MSIKPCIYPGCSNGDNGNAELTTHEMCDSSRRRYWKTLRWLVQDYVILRTELPTPTGGSGPKVSVSIEPGHPAEWASDTAQKIADVLNWTEDALREHLKLLPPPHQYHSATYLVSHAFETMANHFDDLCEFPGAQAAAAEVVELHRDIRSKLGKTRTQTHVSTPCPDCNLITLIREVGLDRSDVIECTNCGRKIQEEHHQLYARILISELLDTA